MKKRIAKITLARETLRHLESYGSAEGDLREAVGGAALPRTDFNTCRCPTVSCKPPGLC